MSERQERRKRNKAKHKAEQPKKNRKKAIAKVKAADERDDGIAFNGRPRCKDTTLGGNPCRSWAAYDDGKCRAHTSCISEERKKQDAMKAAAVRESKRPKPHKIMQQILEQRPELFMKPFLEALGIRIELMEDPQTGEVFPYVEEVSDGMVVYGVSKDGDVVISKHKDLEGQMRAAERLMDRVYGKPKQTQIVVNPATEGITPQVIPYDKARQDEVTKILAEATGHGGHAPAVLPATGSGAGTPQPEGIKHPPSSGNGANN